ncbi:MAG: hypothetical protein IJU91_01170 [Selenomonadaceae bacterium]|nr:hypothetical protein [Selenomonadaceae bacterium]
MFGTRRETNCPYCLRKITLGDLRFFCVDEEDDRHEVSLSLMDRFFKRLPTCQRRFCKNHGLTVREVTCRHCGEKLPAQILFHDKYLSFCAVGVAGAGKSSYVTTVIHELRSSDFPLVLQAMDTETTETALLNEKLVYESRNCLVGTTSGVAPRPQFWTILDNSEASQKLPTYSMTVYDGAGEDCEKIGYTPIDAKISRYISGAGMLLIMFDPLILSSVQNEVPPDVLYSSIAHERKESAPTNMVSMANALVNYVKQSLNIAPGQRIEAPAAVVLTKLDALRDTVNGFAPDSTINRESPHLKRKGFVDADSKMVDLEIRDWLIRQGEIAFLNTIDANFQTVRVFGVSSFGNPPDRNKRLARIRPHRVLDPIMWMLANEGIIPIKN